MPSQHDPYAPYDPFSIDSADGSFKATPDSNTEQVPPKGTSSELLAWVGEDKTRAKLLLSQENESSKPRKGLVDELEEILEK